MTHRITPLVLLALVTGCTGAPSTPGTASPSPGASVAPTTGTPASAAPTASAAPAAPATAADSLTLMIGGAAVTVANRYEVSITGKKAQYDFDKPSGYAPADKWYFDLTLEGKTLAPKAGAFTTADAASVSLTFRQGTGLTSRERVYSIVGIPATAYAVTGGKLDVTYKGTVSKLGFGAGGPGGAEEIEVDLQLKGLPLP